MHLDCYSGKVYLSHHRIHPQFHLQVVARFRVRLVETRYETLEEAQQAAAGLRCSWVLFRLERRASSASLLAITGGCSEAPETIVELRRGGVGFGHAAICARVHALRQPRGCKGAHCPFAATWHLTHCCDGCASGGPHDARCEQRLAPELAAQHASEQLQQKASALVRHATASADDDPSLHAPLQEAAEGLQRALLQAATISSTRRAAPPPVAEQCSPSVS